MSIWETQKWTGARCGWTRKISRLHIPRLPARPMPRLLPWALPACICIAILPHTHVAAYCPNRVKTVNYPQTTGYMLPVTAPPHVISSHQPQAPRDLPFSGEVKPLCTDQGPSSQALCVQSSSTASFQAQSGRRSGTTSFRLTGTRFVQSGIPPL
jgi:hypothetical protein